jgi:sugar lactone lactonase YvrE
LSAPTLSIRGIEPRYVVPGGRIAIRGDGFVPERAHAHHVLFGETRARVTRVSSDTIAVIVPNDVPSHPCEVRIELDGVSTPPHPVSLAARVAEDVQPVANPVFDGDGQLYVTLSGSRGEKLPVSVFRVGLDGNVEPYLSDILNPTGLAWGPDECLYISSRADGTVYRAGANREIEVFADELGTATGIAFDRDGILYVGDRRGTIFRIEPNGEPRSFCHLEPSVAAYHLAFGPDGSLFVTAPSLSPVDPVFRISINAEVEVFHRGFGRPQGMAFDDGGTLYVTEGLVGDSGVYRIGRDRTAECIVAAPPLVGLAFDRNGGLALAGTDSVYEIDGIV